MNVIEKMGEATEPRATGEAKATEAGAEVRPQEATGQPATGEAKATEAGTEVKPGEAGAPRDGEQKERLGMGKEEKLRLKTLVGGLFEKGTSLYDFPLRLTYRAMGEEELENSFKCGAPAGIGEVQMLITVPKKKRRRAVDRVLMRRRIREAYRLNRNSLKRAVAASESVRTLGMAFIYIHGENTDFALIEKKMRRLLSKVEPAVKGKDKNAVKVDDREEKEDVKGKDRGAGEGVNKGSGEGKDTQDGQ